MEDVTRSRIVAVVLAVVLAAVALGGGYVLVFAVAIALSLAGVPITPVLSIVLSTVLLQGVTFGTIALVYLRWRGRPEHFGGFSVPSLKQVGLVVAGYVGMFAILVGVSYTISSTGAPTAQNDVTQIAQGDPRVLLVLLPLSFLLVGPGEELLFRGIIQSELRDHFPAWAAIPVACLVFAGAHTTSLVGSLGGTAVTIGALFCVSLVFGVLYEYTENLTVTAIVHGAYDATLFLALYYSMTAASGSTGLL